MLEYSDECREYVLDRKMELDEKHICIRKRLVGSDGLVGQECQSIVICPLRDAYRAQTVQLKIGALKFTDRY